MKRIAIITGIVALTGIASASAFALSGNRSEPVTSTSPTKTVIASHIEEPTDVVAQESVQPSTPIESVSETPQPVAVVVPTFDELITRYPNMSGDPVLVRCSKAIQVTYPDRFLDSNREHNVALISSHFADSCSATSGDRGEAAGARRFPFMEDNGSGDFFVRSGGA